MIWLLSYYRLLLIFYFEKKYYTCSDDAKLIVFSIFYKHRFNNLATFLAISVKYDRMPTLDRTWRNRGVTDLARRV